MKLMLKAPGTKRLKQTHDELLAILLHLVFIFNLRRYSKEASRKARADAAPAAAAAAAAGLKQSTGDLDPAGPPPAAAPAPAKRRKPAAAAAGTASATAEATANDPTVPPAAAADAAHAANEDVLFTGEVIPLNLTSSAVNISASRRLNLTSTWRLHPLK